MKTELYRYIDDEQVEIIVYYDDEKTYYEQSLDALNYFESIMKNNNPNNTEFDNYNRPKYTYYDISNTILKIKIESIYIHNDYNWNLKEQIKTII